MLGIFNFLKIIMTNKVALFRLSVLGSLTSRIDVRHGELKKLIKAQAEQHFDIPNIPIGNEIA